MVTAVAYMAGRDKKGRESTHFQEERGSHKDAIRLLADPDSWNQDNWADLTDPDRSDDPLKLSDGSRIAVIGGGPAGSMFSYYLLRNTRHLGIDIALDIFEPRDFGYCGPAGCNHCGGVVSESLVQILGTEGVVFPSDVVQRGIQAYEMHMDIGGVKIAAPNYEKRIAAVYRGNGPRNSEPASIVSFDRYLLERATESGANLQRQMVTSVSTEGEKPRLFTTDGSEREYDLLVVACGINTTLLEIIDESGCGYARPRGLKSFVCEFHVGREFIEARLGNSMHVFLLDIPRLQFAAMIPKGEYLTMVMLGKDLDENLVEAFLNSEEVRSCLPQGKALENVCQCFPRLNMIHARRPYDDRLVFIGDAGVARLYKDGIGSAYRTAKSAANCVSLQGFARADFKRHYWKTCRAIAIDNAIGRLVFGFCHVLQKVKFMRRGVLRMTRIEQEHPDHYPHMSSVLWDVFTGSAPYREILLHVLHPGFIFRLIWNMLIALVPTSLHHDSRLQTP
jgi:flavin-dependent dehydrogenase